MRKVIIATPTFLNGSSNNTCYVLFVQFGSHYRHNATCPVRVWGVCNMWGECTWGERQSVSVWLHPVLLRCPWQQLRQYRHNLFLFPVLIIDSQIHGCERSIFSTRQHAHTHTSTSVLLAIWYILGKKLISCEVVLDWWLLVWRSLLVHDRSVSLHQDT